jgi:dipeptidyl aminopeptidase/acylaminoacyl peptidase
MRAYSTHRPCGAGLRGLAITSLSAVSLTALVPTALARPLEIADVLKLEGVGDVTFSPDGTEVVVNRLSAYDTALRFGRPFMDGLDLSRLLRAKTQSNGEARPALAAEQDKPHWHGAFSPSGKSLAIYWLDGDDLKAGIIRREAGTPVTLPVNPDLSITMQKPVWVSEDELLYVELAPGLKPLRLAAESGYVSDYPARWNDTISGRRATSTILYSGNAGQNATSRPSKLVLVRADGTTKRDIADGEFIQATVSPDGRFVVAVRLNAFVPHEADRLLDHGRGQQLADIMLIDLKSPAAPKILCENCDPGVTPVDWSPDSRHLLVFDNGKGTVLKKGFHLLDLAGHATAFRTDDLTIASEWRTERIRAGAATYVSGGLFMFASRASDPSKRADWYWVTQEDQPVALTSFLGKPPSSLIATRGNAAFLVGDDALWRIAPGRAPQKIPIQGDGTLEAQSETSPYDDPLTPVDADTVVVRRRGGPDGDMLIFVDTKSLRQTALPIPGNSANVLAKSDKTHSAVVRDPGGAISLLSGAKPPRLLTAINAHLKDVTAPEARRIVRKDRKGNDVADWLLLPQTSAPGPFPMVAYIYPGSIERSQVSPYATVRDIVRNGPRPLLARGYAVLIPSIPLTDGEPLSETADEVNKAVDAAIGTGLIDARRLGIFGHSFGGYGVMSVLTQTDRFKAGIALAGPADLASGYGQMDARFRLDVSDSLGLFGASLSETGQIALKAAPWQDPDKYVRNSPTFQAGKIKTPLMLVQGDFDYVSMTQGEEMFTALRRQNKDAVFVRYWGEGHLLMNPTTMVDLDQRIADWLHKYMPTK